MIEHLIAAAAEARKLTVKVGVVGTDIEIIVTELGLVTRGVRFAGALKAKANHQLDWPEFLANPALLVSQVRLVNDALLAKVAKAPGE